MRMNDGGTYSGYVINNKLNGQGTYNWINGDKYVGEFRNGKKHGHGTYNWASGNKWVGEFRNGKFWDGNGVLQFKSGDKYVGGIKNGKKHGHGTYNWASGNKWVGEWKNDKVWDGNGAIQYKNGNIYVGGIKNGKKHGHGTFTFADGRVKEGIWKKDKFFYTQKISPSVTARKSSRSGSHRRSDPDKVVPASSGSGFAVSLEGHVITNNHVINGCQKVKIHHQGQSIAATIITFDPQNDLALLKGKFSPSTVFSLSHRQPELAQDIYVAGYPFGRKISTSVKVTKGIISSLTGIGNNFANLQIDAALQPGNSGGPILDNRGNVVGVAVAKLDIKKVLKNFGVIPEDTNFGIKTSVVRSILESNNVSLPSPHPRSISKSKLGKMISDGTYYISCWMTLAQIKKMRSKKVIFQSLD